MLRTRVSHNTMASTKYCRWKTEVQENRSYPNYQNHNGWQRQHKAARQKHLASSSCPNMEWPKIS